MKYFSEICVLMILISALLTVQSLPLNTIGSSSTFRYKRALFERSTASTTTTKKPPMPNNLEIGICKEDDKLIYVDDTRIESNNSTLSGVIEIYVDSEYFITCAKILDQLKPGTGAMPSFSNSTESGGPGNKFIKINVQGQKHNGIHFKVMVYGAIRSRSESNDLDHLN